MTIARSRERVRRSPDPRTPEEIARLTALVKEAVGFDIGRGDTVNVMSAPFDTPAPAEPLPAQPIWEQQWVWDIARQAGGALLVLLIAFGVLRPLMKNLVARDLAERGTDGAEGAVLAGGDVADDRLSLSAGTAGGRRKALGNQAEQAEAVRALVGQDPRRVANVIKDWVGDDG